VISHSSQSEQQRRVLKSFGDLDLPALLSRKAHAHADKPFLVWEPFDAPSRALSYGDFAERVARFAAGLHSQGVEAGQYVVLHMENCPEFLIAWHACSRLGAVVVTTNPQATAAELTYLIQMSRARVIVTEQRHHEVLRRCEIDPALIVSKDGNEAKLALTCARLSFEDCSGDPRTLPGRPADLLAANSVQFTSGTTARPKGVVWTHANALWCASTTAANLDLTEQDVALAYMPLFHTNALCYAMLSTIWSGGTLVLIPKFSASRFWSIATRNGCTWASMLPFTMKALERTSDPDRPHCFRLWAPGMKDANAERRWGIATLGWWGMTETIGQPIIAKLGAASTPGAMGEVAPGYEVDVVDDVGRSVGAGETGNLKVRGIRGVSMFREYLHDPEATRASFDPHGWFDTGDRVTRLETGEYRFSDRAKDVIRVGGENVAASEVERVIASISGVAEVAVVAKPHVMLDQVPVAFVVVDNEYVDKLGERILAACRSHLSAFKVPVEILFVESLPRSLLNKIDKKALRARLQTITLP
jgi:carnitine-CoA ligase